MQSTVNDVLDLYAITNGKFKLKTAPVLITADILTTLRRCRAYMSSDVTFQFKLPAQDLLCGVDMLRVSQILSNAIRCVFACVLQNWFHMRPHFEVMVGL